MKKHIFTDLNVRLKHMEVSMHNVLLVQLKRYLFLTYYTGYNLGYIILTDDLNKPLEKKKMKNH